MRPETIKKSLITLRKKAIEQQDDIVAARVAYAMEMAIRKVTEDGLVGWPSLQEEAFSTAELIRQDMARSKMNARRAG